MKSSRPSFKINGYIIYFLLTLAAFIAAITFLFLVVIFNSK